MAWLALAASVPTAALAQAVPPPPAQTGPPAYAAPAGPPQAAAPPAPPSAPPPAEAEPPAPAPAPQGQWIYTQQYGWLWMTYDDAHLYVPPSGVGEPLQYVYYPTVGWTWIAAPWVWGIGPWPYFRGRPPTLFAWYRHGWWRTPTRWQLRPAPARDRASSRGIRPAPAWERHGHERAERHR